MKKLSFSAQIALSLVLSVIVGCLMQNYADFAQTYIAPFGAIFLNLLKFIVVPLVLLSVISGIISMKDIKLVGKLGLRSLLYFMVTTVFAVTLGLVLSSVLADFFPVVKIPSTNTVEAVSITLMDQIVAMFPKNIIEPLSSMLMMQVIVIAIFFGVAIVNVGEKAKYAKEVVLSFNEVVTKVLAYIMALSPIGIFCMLTPVVAVNGPTVLGSFAVLILVTYLCFVIHAVFVYSAAVRALGKISPLKFFKGMAPAMLFAYSSDSSIATLPYTEECAGKLGVKKPIREFVLPLGATINMDGVAIYLGVTSVFVAHCAGIHLTMGQYVSIALAATVASIGTPGIPGGALALMAMVFASAGLPLEGVAIVAGIDRIVDMGRTTMSITGDASCAIVMQRFCGNQVPDSEAQE